MPPAIHNLESRPLVSVIILNYNGQKWLERCIDSLQKQTIADRIEVIIADNKSSDGSDVLAEKLLFKFPNSSFIQNGANLGFCEGNNRAVPIAKSDFLFFLNNDTWLEPECLEKLLKETSSFGASAATPLVLNYEDDSFQALGTLGFDFFGLPSARFFHADTRQVLMAEGCSYFVRRDLFQNVGQFDAEFFMFADEFDLSWRIWIAGHSIIAATSSRLHHRGMAHVNPKGGREVVEFRTSDIKRFYTNRNLLLVLLKNAQHILLLLVPLQIGLFALESMAGWALLRRWSFVKKSFIDALADCWRLRHHVVAERRRIKGFRKRSDWQMLRFLTLRFNRWYEFKRLTQYGLPKVNKS